MPNFKYFVYMSYRMNKSYYSINENKIGRTRQGNCFVGDICRDESCIIIKVPEEKGLRMIIEVKIKIV